MEKSGELEVIIGLILAGDDVAESDSEESSDGAVSDDPYAAPPHPMSQRAL